MRCVFCSGANSVPAILSVNDCTYNHFEPSCIAQTGNEKSSLIAAQAFGCTFMHSMSKFINGLSLLTSITGSREYAQLARSLPHSSGMNTT